jgi:hypothetical protein
MGIDPVGKSSGAGIAPASVSSADAPVNVDAPEEFSTDVQEASEVKRTSLVDQLRGGEIDLETYLNMRVDQATAHLAGYLDEERLANVQSTLRTQIEEDPALIELVKKATET